MKLATLKSQDTNRRDGELIVVSSDNTRAARVHPVMSLRLALENWKDVAPRLEALSQTLDKGSAPNTFAVDLSQCQAPLPHSPGFYDGSAFLSHVYRARKSRGDEMPASARITPLMYQGVSDWLLPWNAPIDLMNASFGGDFEGEFAAITTDVPRGTSAVDAVKYVALFVLFNDITYREIVKTELETKFGFLQSKPNSSFAPFAVTPSELESAWDGKRISLEMRVVFNGSMFGHPNGNEMHFTFGELIAHACRTRPLSAGSIIGTGTVSNEDKGKGFACLTEKRFQEILDSGKASTPWLKAGDRVQIDVVQDSVSVFGSIDETARL